MEYNHACGVVVHNWLLGLPENPTPHTIYFIKNGDRTDMYVTDKSGNPTLINGESGTFIHNLLSGLQGGSAGEYYHLNESQLQRVLDLIYIDGTSTITLSPTSGERGAETSIDVNYSITSNDDTITSASINQGIGDVLSDVDQGIQTVSGGTSAVNKTFTLSLDYERNGQSVSETKSTTYTAHIPQFLGTSAEEDYTTYSDISSDLDKYIQASATLQRSMSPTDEYIWLISNKNNATVLDQNNFSQTVGAWGNETTEFWLQPLTLTLSDGVTTAPVYLYRSRQTKNFNNIIYKIQ